MKCNCIFDGHSFCYDSLMASHYQSSCCYDGVKDEYGLNGISVDTLSRTRLNDQFKFLAHCYLF